MSTVGGGSILGTLIAFFAAFAMAFRTRHGTGAKSGNIGKVVEGLAPKELPAFVPAPAVPVVRDDGGRVRTSEAAKELGRRGGLAKAAKRTNLGPFAKAMKSEFRGLDEDEGFAPFVEEAQLFYIQTCEHYSVLAGGAKPQCSPVVASHVEAAATARMFARFYRAIATRKAFLWDVDETSKPKKATPRTDYAAAASKQFDAMRAALSAAHEYAVREAKARADRGDGVADDAPWIDAPSIEEPNE